MAVVVSIDDRGRIKLPKDLVVGRRRMLVVPAGRRIVLIPIPPAPTKAAEGWMPLKGKRSEAKRLAEEEALEEISRKLGRRVDRADRD